MELTDKQKEQFIKFFKISTAAFTFSKSLCAAFGREMDEKTKAMIDLHKEALKYLETEEKPELDIMHSFLVQMEIVASRPNPPLYLYESGTESSKTGI